jgi:hypothetical protein
MIIEIIGMDPYRVGEISRHVQPKFDRLPELKNIPLFFSSSETTLFHHGVDQNTWVVIIKLHLEQQFVSLAPKIETVLVQALQEDAIHVHVYVLPIDSQLITVHMNPEYPPYVQEQEEVDGEPLPEQDIFLGNAFEKHQEELDKKATKNNPFPIPEDDDSHKH